jgi:prevent-host-death family protein
VSHPTISIRQLHKHASAVLAEVERVGEPVLITRAGAPIAVLTPLTEPSDAAAVASADLEHMREPGST